MSKTVRKFKGKTYQQGHEPAALDLERKRTLRKKLTYAQAYSASADDIAKALGEAAALEAEAMGYGEP